MLYHSAIKLQYPPSPTSQPRRAVNPLRLPFTSGLSLGTLRRLHPCHPNPMIGELEVKHRPLFGHMTRHAIGLLHRAGPGFRPETFALAGDARLIALWRPVAII